MGNRNYFNGIAVIDLNICSFSGGVTPRCLAAFFDWVIWASVARANPEGATELVAQRI
jgi:hypothetical protein